MNRLSDKLLAMMPEKINGLTKEEMREQQRKNESVGGGFFYFKGHKFSSLLALRSDLEAIQEFEVRDDDVYIITYPKSGTHWVTEMVDCIMNDGKDGFHRKDFGLEFCLPSLGSKIPVSGYKIINAEASPRRINSHLSKTCLPPKILKAKVIYMARNPKDLLSSFIKFANLLGKTDTGSDMASYVWENLSGSGTMGSWFDHVLDYWEHRNDENFLFLKYEDFHKDLRTRVLEVAKFVGKELSDEAIDNVIKITQFNNMKKTYQKIEEESGQTPLTHFEGQPHLAKGKVGTWKNVFTVAQSELFDEIYADKMKGSGLEFEYEV